MARRDWYLIAWKYAGLPALAMLILGLIASPLRDALVDEETADEVLLQAIPYVAIFITIILLFILTIAFVAIRLHKRMVNHAHQAIEWTLVGGIVIGLTSMLQRVNIVAYEFGFLLLLFSLLAFILWTHVTPASAGEQPSGQRTSNKETRMLGVLLVVGILVGLVSMMPRMLFDNDLTGDKFGFLLLTLCVQGFIFWTQVQTR